MKKVLIALSMVIMLFSAQPCFGQGGAITEPGTQSPTIYIKKGDSAGVLPSFTEGYSVVPTEKLLDQTVVRFINTLSNIFIGFSVLFLVIGGLQYVLAQGDEEKIKKAHRSVIWSVAGVILIMFSYGIIYIVNTIF